MKKIALLLSIILLFSATAFAAVEIVDPSTRSMYVDEGFECPYVLQISDQEGYPFTAAEMAAITKIKVFFGETQYLDSDTCADCFDWTTKAANSQIIVDLGSYNWTDGTDTATLFVYTATYTKGLRVGTFSMKASGALATAGLTPSSGILASFINLDTTTFDNNLSATDDDLQTAMETLDDMVGGTGTDDQTAAEVPVTTTAFGGILANDATSDTVQKCLDLLDDTISGGVSIVTVTETGTLTAEQLTGSRIEYTGTTTSTFTLGSAEDAYMLSQGASTFIFMSTVGAYFDPAIGDKITYIDGSIHTMDDGDKLSALTPAKYDAFTIRPVKDGSDYQWLIHCSTGLYEDGGP